MPFPLLGPTTLFHLLVIFFGVLWRLMIPRQWRERLADYFRRRPLLSSAIVATVFAVIFMSATSIVYLTATDNRSTFRVVSAYFEEPVPGIELNVASLSSPAARIAHLPECTTDSVEQSLLEYLEAEGRNNSFQSRQQLAFAFGITGYSGTSEENAILLQLILKADCHGESY